jgi:hypothetical protein
MTHSQLTDHHELLATAISNSLDLSMLRPSGPAYQHMGAIIVDASLQAGLNYASVVRPRVHRLLESWPNSDTTTRFLDSCLRWGLVDVLRWSHPEKLQRALRLTMLLVAHRVDTVEDLAAWAPAERDTLLTVPGVGPKTADYLASLAGAPAVAIDRHLEQFAMLAGIAVVGYDSLADTYRKAAGMLDVDLSALDRAIWALMSSNAGAIPRLAAAS